MGEITHGAARKRREKQLIKRVQHWFDLFSLGEWNLEVKFGRDEQNYASVTRSPEYREATMLIDIEMIEASRFSFDEIIRHELFHMVLADFRDTVENLLPAKLKDHKLVKDAEELLVTRLSRMRCFESL